MRWRIRTTDTYLRPWNEEWSIVSYAGTLMKSVPGTKMEYLYEYTLPFIRLFICHTGYLYRATGPFQVALTLYQQLEYCTSCAYCTGISSSTVLGVVREFCFCDEVAKFCNPIDHIDVVIWKLLWPMKALYDYQTNFIPTTMPHTIPLGMFGHRTLSHLETISHPVSKGSGRDWAGNFVN